MWTIKAFGESPPVDIPQKLLAFVSLNGSGDQALNIPEFSSLVKTTDIEILSQTSNRTVVSAKANGLEVTIEYFGTNFGTSSAVITGFNGQSDDGKYLFKIDEIVLRLMILKKTLSKLKQAGLQEMTWCWAQKMVEAYGQD